MNKRFYIDEDTKHILWLEGDDFLCAPYSRDGLVFSEDTIYLSIDESGIFPDLAANNCQIRAILLRRRGDFIQAEEWDDIAEYYKKQARENPDNCTWSEEREVVDYLEDIKKNL